jgi:hypothetical protein
MQASPHHRVLTPPPAPIGAAKAGRNHLNKLNSALLRRTGRLRKRDNWMTGGGREGEGAKSHGGVKAWSSINRSMLYASPDCTL